MISTEEWVVPGEVMLSRDGMVSTGKGVVPGGGLERRDDFYRRRGSNRSIGGCRNWLKKKLFT